MAGKITELTALATGHATGDLMELVDISDTTMSANGTNKKTTLGQLLANLPTVLLAPDGTVSLPAFSFQNDPDCGFYRIGANNIGLSINGFKAVDINAATFIFSGVNVTIAGNSLDGDKNVVLPRTSDLTLALFSSIIGETITNTGAAGEVIITLPTSSTGVNYRFYVTAAQYLRVKAAGTDIIRHAAATSAAAGYIRANTIGNCIRIECTVSGVWAVTSVIGTWTIDS